MSDSLCLENMCSVDIYRLSDSDLLNMLNLINEDTTIDLFDSIIEINDEDSDLSNDTIEIIKDELMIRGLL